MAINIDESEFPLVKVIFTEEKFTDENYIAFLNKWLEYYIRKEDFRFHMDTTRIKEIPPLKYSLYLCNFLRKLKKDNSYHYLKESEIIIADNKIKYLLDFIFHIQKPVAPIKIIRI